MKLRCARVFVAGLLTAAGALPASAQTLTTLATFGCKPDGSSPAGTLADVGGSLYGATGYGGTDNVGTVFKVDPSTGTETTRYSFLTGSGQAVSPQFGVIYVKGYLYGTAWNNGENNGSVFKVNAKTGAESVLYTMKGGTDADGPQAGLIYEGGLLVGTSYGGGTGGQNGTVFTVDPNTGAEQVLYSFTGGTDGRLVNGNVIYVKGAFYGTTSAGGSGAGTVYKLDANSHAETVLYRFAGGNDGASPMAGLVYHDGFLYGTTNGGGTSGDGTVFKVNAVTGAETVLHSFTGPPDGTSPFTGVTYGNGMLYGVTLEGGDGTLYSVNPKNGNETVLVPFNINTTGAEPNGDLLFKSGAFYGVTGESPGARSCGSVFKFVP